MRSVAEVTKDIEEVQNREAALYAKREECLEASWKEPLRFAWQGMFPLGDTTPELKAQFEQAYSWEQVNGQPTTKVSLSVEWAAVEAIISKESFKISRLRTSGIGYSDLTPEELAELTYKHHVADVLIKFAQNEDVLRGLAESFLKVQTEDEYMLALIQESKLISILHEALNTELKAIKEAELSKKYNEAAKVGNLIFKGMSAHLVSRVTNKCVFLIPITVYTKDNKAPVVENFTAEDIATLRSLADLNSSGRKEYSEESKIDTVWVKSSKRLKTHEFGYLIEKATIVQA